jgi:hypothetical protein
MSLKWYTTEIDCRDHRAQAHWWAEALGWRVAYEDEFEAQIVPADVDTESPLDRDSWYANWPTLGFAPVPEGKTLKNRLHLDLAPHITDDREAEIARLLRIGASAVDVGQDEDVTWTVLADPEGNEFCVLSSRDRS